MNIHKQAYYVLHGGTQFSFSDIFLFGPSAVPKENFPTSGTARHLAHNRIPVWRYVQFPNNCSPGLSPADPENGEL